MVFSFVSAVLAAGFTGFHYWFWKQADRTGRGASYRDTSRLTVFVLGPLTIILLGTGIVQVLTR